MSLYNMLFGMNSQTPLLLAVIGLKENDVERFRDVSVEDEGKTIAVYARTGGNNRADYPQVALYQNPLFVTTADDDFDNTYATFRFRVPDEFAPDVAGLRDIIGNGLRKEFAAHLATTLNREATEGDKHAQAYDAERRELGRHKHSLANGHTFVPHDDGAMEAALKLAEANAGSLRTCWGILPLIITIKTNHTPFPNARDSKSATYMTRVEVGYEWKIDEPYWEHCRERFASDFPIVMAKIAEAVERHQKKRA